MTNYTEFSRPNSSTLVAVEEGASKARARLTWTDLVTLKWQADPGKEQECIRQKIVHQRRLMRRHGCNLDKEVMEIRADRCRSRSQGERQEVMVAGGPSRRRREKFNRMSRCSNRFQTSRWQRALKQQKETSPVHGLQGRSLGKGGSR